MRNALAQAVLKLTVPGVPDTYQGCELWDLNLVDPDNRRPVDYAQREALLHALCHTTPQSLIESWADGRIKLHVLSRLARLRREQPALFDDGRYLPLATPGPHDERLCAFARVANDAACVVVVPLGATWDDTIIALPAELAGRAWTDALTAVSYAPAERFPAARLFETLPVAVLITPPPPA
jgi:(1->4)-alpha-D-glucan 1-alpha-D-glucosylmutase